MPPGDTPAELRAWVEKNRLQALERRARKRGREEEEVKRNAEAGRPTGDAIGESAGTSAGQFGTSEKACSFPLNPSRPNAPTPAPPLKKPMINRSEYIEFDMSNVRDTRGGFLADSETSHDTSTKPGDLSFQRKLELRKHELEHAPPVPLDPSEDVNKCCECSSIILDPEYLKYFHLLVCRPCINTHPDKYSLITKTEARTDYMLTEGELRDIPFMKKVNPRKSTWSLMWLYCRCQLEDFALNKYGTFEDMDKLYETKEREKAVRKELKFKKNLRDLRHRTRTSLWSKEKRSTGDVEKEEKAGHVHTFCIIEGKDGMTVERCSTCGMETTVEEF